LHTHDVELQLAPSATFRRRLRDVTRIATVFALGLALGACGAGSPPEPPPPPPFSPVGDYSVTIEAEGMSIGGSMSIQNTNDVYSGSIDTEMGGAALADIIVTGMEMSFTIPDVGLSFMLTFDGDEFTGQFDGDMGAGSIYGTKDPGR